MNHLTHKISVLHRLFTQSWLAIILAAVYATWELYYLADSERTPAIFIRSFAVAYFLMMWFAGQWYRVSKQLNDAERFTNLQEGLDKVLSMLERQTNSAVEEAAMIETPPVLPVNPTSNRPNEEPITRVLEEISRSPKGALLILGAELERELRLLVWGAGWLSLTSKFTITRTTQELVKMKVVPESLGDSVRAFLEIRNRLLHGYGVTDDELLRAVDIGLTILRVILAIPRQTHLVHNPSVVLYEDEQGTQPRLGVKGVLLKSLNPDGTSSINIYPTTRSYNLGERLSWEWDMSRVIGKTWYRDPDTNQIVPAWTQAAEFVGRNLETL